MLVGWGGIFGSKKGKESSLFKCCISICRIRGIQEFREENLNFVKSETCIIFNFEMIFS